MVELIEGMKVDLHVVLVMVPSGKWATIHLGKYSVYYYWLEALSFFSRFMLSSFFFL